MIITHHMLLSQLKDYGAPANKIMRMVHAGELIPLNKGIYETDRTASPICLAASIYGPSYVSFEYALSHYGLIPERVVTITCATFKKRRRKTFENAFGMFTYQDVPSRVFPLELRIKTENENAYRIASPEKALCDELYKAQPVNSIKQLQVLLYEDLRIESLDFANLDHDILKEMAPLYRKKNLQLLSKLLEKGR